MKREWSHDRGAATRFVRPNAGNQFNSVPDFSVTRQQSGPRRKIFVIKRTSRLRLTNNAGKKIQRILVFDNHPDSLRLVLGGRANRDVDLSRSHRGRLWELIIVSTVAVAGIIGMFWPLL